MNWSLQHLLSISSNHPIWSYQPANCGTKHFGTPDLDRSPIRLYSAQTGPKQQSSTTSLRSWPWSSKHNGTLLYSMPIIILILLSQECKVHVFPQNSNFRPQILGKKYCDTYNKNTPTQTKIRILPPNPKILSPTHVLVRFDLQNQG